MQMTIPQDELETAIRNYVSGIGLTLEVTAINFTAARSQGGKIITEIELGAISSNQTETPQEKPLAAVVPASAVAKAQGKKAETAPAPKAVVAAEAVESSDTDDTTPPGKSLFA